MKIQHGINYGEVVGNMCSADGVPCFIVLKDDGKFDLWNITGCEIVKTNSSTLKTGGTEAGQEVEQPQQPQPEIAEMNKAVRCLAIQVPSSVYDDVKKKWDAVVAQLSGVR